MLFLIDATKKWGINKNINKIYENTPINLKYVDKKLYL